MIQLNTKEQNQYMLLDVGKSLSIPLLFEYFLSSSESNPKSEITKSIGFDLKPSLVKDMEHYIISITAKYDYTQSNSSISGMTPQLNDSLTEI